MRSLLLAVALLAAAAPGAGAQLPGRARARRARVHPHGRRQCGAGRRRPGAPRARSRCSTSAASRRCPAARSPSPAGGNARRVQGRRRRARPHPSAAPRHLGDDGRADGTIYAVERDEIVHRLPPGGPRWERVFDPVLQVPRWRQFDDEVESIAALPGGGFVFTADLGAFRVGDDGSHAEIALPRGWQPEYAAATEGGDALVVVIDDRNRERLVRIPAGGSPVTLGVRGIFFGIAAAPGGVLLRSSGWIDAFGPDGERLARIGVRRRHGSRRRRAGGRGEDRSRSARWPSAGVWSSPTTSSRAASSTWRRSRAASRSRCRSSAAGSGRGCACSRRPAPRCRSPPSRAGPTPRSTTGPWRSRARSRAARR